MDGREMIEEGLQIVTQRRAQRQNEIRRTNILRSKLSKTQKPMNNIIPQYNNFGGWCPIHITIENCQIQLLFDTVPFMSLLQVGR